MTTRILIADDHGVLRAGLHALLNAEPDMEVVAEAADGEEAFRLADQLRPDIVLMDISMGEVSGIEVTKQLIAAFPSLRVLVLTVYEDKELLHEAIRVGASGYVLKRAAKSELINAIHVVMSGNIYVHPAMMRTLFEKTSPAQNPAYHEELTLTSREIEILRLIAMGYTNYQIAEQLTISVRTVEFHRGNVMAKLQLENRMELVRYATKHGLLT